MQTVLTLLHHIETYIGLETREDRVKFVIASAMATAIIIGTTLRGMGYDV